MAVGLELSGSEHSSVIPGSQALKLHCLWANLVPSDLGDNNSTYWQAVKMTRNKEQRGSRQCQARASTLVCHGGNCLQLAPTQCWLLPCVPELEARR